MDYRNVCSDGMALNMLHVFQQLSIKIKVDKIDCFYLHHPKCRINMKDVTRLKASSQEVTDWITSLSTSLHVYSATNSNSVLFHSVRLQKKHLKIASAMLCHSNYVSYNEHKTNDFIWQQVNECPCWMSDLIVRRRKLLWFSHVY